MAEIPRGKGVMIWQLAECKSATMFELAAALYLNGFDWVCVKVADGRLPYNVGLLPAFTDACSQKRIPVYGWHYIYGPKLGGLSQAEAEARKAAELVKAYDLSVLLVDAEKEYKAIGSQLYADVYMNKLRELAPDLSVGLCSYRFPTVHPEFPWEVFAERVDFFAPQMYWLQADNPVDQLTRCLVEYRGLRSKPVVPIGSAYYEHGWEPTAGEVSDFQKAVRYEKLPGIGWWAWDDRGLQDHPGLLAVVKDDEWSLRPPPPDPGDEPDWAELDARLGDLDVVVENIRAWRAKFGHA